MSDNRSEEERRKKEGEERCRKAREAKATKKEEKESAKKGWAPCTVKEWGTAVRDWSPDGSRAGWQKEVAAGAKRSRGGPRRSEGQGVGSWCGAGGQLPWGPKGVPRWLGSGFVVAGGQLPREPREEDQSAKPGRKY